MLTFTPLFELVVSSAINNDQEANETPSSNSQQNNLKTQTLATSSGEKTSNKLSSQEVGKIIENNKKEPESRSVVNINPSSALELSKQSANSASSAANRFGNESNNAGQRSSSLTNSYVTKPTKVPGRLNTNPTFTARGI